MLSAIQTLLFLFALATFCLLLIGLLWPKAALWWAKTQTRGRVALIYLPGLFVLVFAWAAVDNNQARGEWEQRGPEILAEVEQMVDDGRLEDAIDVAERYERAGIEDSALTAYHKRAQEGLYLSDLENTEPDELTRKERLYENLVELDPENKEYRAGLEETKARIVELEAEEEQQQQQSQTVELTGSVTHTGGTFQVQNRDGFDWTNITLELNHGTFSSGYTFEAARIGAGETVNIAANQFTDSSGERFNPVTHAPQRILIRADTPQGRGGYAAEW